MSVEVRFLFNFWDWKVGAEKGKSYGWFKAWERSVRAAGAPLHSRNENLTNAQQVVTDSAPWRADSVS